MTYDEATRDARKIARRTRKPAYVVLDGDGVDDYYAAYPCELSTVFLGCHRVMEIMPDAPPSDAGFMRATA